MAGLGSVALSLWAALGEGYLADLCRQFPALYLGGILVSIPLLLGVGRSRWALALLLPGLLWNLHLIGPRHRPEAPRPFEAGAEAPTLDLLYFNVLGSNPHRDRLARFVDESGAEVVVVAELRPPLEEALARGLPTYRRLLAEPRDDNFGIGLWATAGAVESGRVVDGRILRWVADDFQYPAVEATLRWGGREARLLGAHLMPPTSPRAARMRAEGIASILDWQAIQGDPTVVIGDLNTGPWGEDFAPLLAAGLRDGARGFGLRATWPARQPPGLRIPLDHVLHDPALRVVDHRVGPSLGSDHLALRVRLAWREAADR